MRPEFREYCRTDRDACISLFRTNVPRYFREHELEEFLQFIDTSGCPYFVVTVGEAVLGCGGFGIRSGSDRADLCWGMVDSSRHRKGIGEFLLVARLHVIVNKTDATSVRLGTSQLTDGFYERFGFAVQSRTADGIAEGLDDVQMVMELSDDVRDVIRRRWSEIGD